MDQLEELIETYRMTNSDGRDRLRSFARQLQKRFPASARLALTLVKNANDVQSTNYVGHGRVDLCLVGNAGEAVNSK